MFISGSAIIMFIVGYVIIDMISSPSVELSPPRSQIKPLTKEQIAAAKEWQASPEGRKHCPRSAP